MIIKDTIQISFLALAFSFLCSCSGTPNSGVATLHFQNPLARTLNFEAGEFGQPYSENLERSLYGDIEFGDFQRDSFSVPKEGWHGGLIMDLGSSDTLSRNYGIFEVSGVDGGFASIQILDDELVLLQDFEEATAQPLLQSKGLYQEHRGVGSAIIKSGHIYLVRVTDLENPSFERLVKFRVIGYSPGQTVTIQWVRLAG